MKDFPRVEVASAEAWRRWLTANASHAGSIWLVTFKKGKGPYVPYGELVDEALCFGWIDSLPRRLDACRTQLLMSPRRAGSGWSTVNKHRIARLVAAGRMDLRGVASIEQAKRDGSWELLDRAGALTVADDVASALRRASASASHNFDAFPPSVRRGILEWIDQAKRPETRARRIEATATAAVQNKRVGQWEK